MRRLLLCAALFVGAARAALAADAAAGKWTPLEMLKYRTVSDVRVSPDGKRVAYVVRDSVMETDKSEYRQQIWIASSDGKASRQATFAEQSSTRPRWSPDGRRIAFLSKRADKFANVWLLPTDGGEAWRLTDAKSDISQAAWSPDGKWIAFIAPEPAPQDKERRDREKDDARVVGEDDRPGRLWLISVPPEAGGAREARQLTAFAASIGGVPEAGPGEALDWSPDGKTIAFSHTTRPVIDDWPASDISLVEVATGQVRPLAHTGAAETEPLYSPDGKWIACLVTDDPPRWAHRRWVRLVPADGGPSRDLPHSFDEAPELAGWSADGATLYFAEARGVYDFSTDSTSGPAGSPRSPRPAWSRMGPASTRAAAGSASYARRLPIPSRRTPRRCRPSRRCASRASTRTCRAMRSARRA